MFQGFIDLINKDQAQVTRPEAGQHGVGGEEFAAAFPRGQPVQTNTSRPLRSITESKRAAAPLGFFSPFSHFCTVEMLALR